MLSPVLHCTGKISLLKVIASTLCVSYTPIIFRGRKKSSKSYPEIVRVLSISKVLKMHTTFSTTTSLGTICLLPNPLFRLTFCSPHLHIFLLTFLTCDLNPARSEMSCSCTLTIPLTPRSGGERIEEVKVRRLIG